MMMTFHLTVFCCCCLGCQYLSLVSRAYFTRFHALHASQVIHVECVMMLFGVGCDGLWWCDVVMMGCDYGVV